MIRAVLIDDEKLALTTLSRKLSETGKIEIINTYTDPAKLLGNLERDAAEAAFVDIEMGPVSGLDLAEEILHRVPDMQIVFVTGHSEYAVRAFELDSIDYILKPVTTGRLNKTVARLKGKVADARESARPAPAPNPLCITTLGEFRAFYGGRPLAFKTAKVKELLAFLIVQRNIPVHRDVLIDSLWPEQQYKKAKIHLHTCLSHLRKTLEQAGHPGAISFSGQSYTLTPGPLELDLDLIRAASAEDTGIRSMEKAVGAYKGRLFEQEAYPWATKQAEDIHRQVIVLLDRLIDFYQEEDLERALEYLHLQQIHDPYLDRSIRNRMLVLVQQGNRMEALRLYEQHVRLLDEELGIDPDARLTELYRLLSKA
ncbi:BTAD domain-containing putative transcriptional regulator [Bhargavaea ullalensis]|uniref:Two-component SAPR family response regulator n=1 Tax=Bhargavaea ullalensis TaxID=1265685 RepID=A0ABV2GEA0_9BACL